MLPRERVFAALEHREADRIPWGEHSIDYNVYEDILGRETLVQAKMKDEEPQQAQLLWQMFMQELARFRGFEDIKVSVGG